MEEMKKKERTVTQIEEEPRNVDLSKFLGFDDIARYEGCFGPLLGNLEVLCKREGVRYGSGAVKSFEIWLKRVSGLREAIEAGREKRDEI